jgi:hypothetical protein
VDILSEKALSHIVEHVILPESGSVGFLPDNTAHIMRQEKT